MSMPVNLFLEQELKIAPTNEAAKIFVLNRSLENTFFVLKNSNEKYLIYSSDGIVMAVTDSAAKAFKYTPIEFGVRVAWAA